MIYAYSQRLMHNPDLADEATQATFVQAFSKLDRFRGESNFKTWLHAVALNECRVLRRSRHPNRHVPLDQVPEIALSSESSTGDGEVELQRFVEQLPPRQRSVVALRIYSDLPFKDIARIERITENSAKVSFHHAIQRLRGWLVGEPSS